VDVIGGPVTVKNNVIETGKCLIKCFLALFKYFDFVGLNDVDELLSYFNTFIITVLDIILPLNSWKGAIQVFDWFDWINTHIMLFI